jgi:transposase
MDQKHTKETSDFQEIINGLAEKLAALEERIIELEKENLSLRERLSKYEVSKNSGNSSIPPSKDENRPIKTKSLRVRSGKKPGGQPGRKGNTLKMTTHPDEVFHHNPNCCSGCGQDLSLVEGIKVGTRQVVDIPPIVAHWEEHRIYEKQCSCGKVVKGKFPANVTSPVRYGARVTSLIGYWHGRQYIPFARMKEIFHDIFNLPISEGGIHYLLKRLSTKALPAYEKIKENLLNSAAVGADETGVKVNAAKHWFWTWQDQNNTFIVQSNNRGMKTIDQHFENGLEKSILIHDCWRPHFNTAAKGHQICIAHLLRDLNYLTEKYSHKWSKGFKALLNKALKVKNEMGANDYNQLYKPRIDLEKGIKRMTDLSIDKKCKELITFQKRMVRYADYLLTFLYHLNVPPDNNGSERAIRNVKVKQKISGQFKSPNGAQQFAIIRSVIDTAIKNDQNVLDSLVNIANAQIN